LTPDAPGAHGVRADRPRAGRPARLWAVLRARPRLVRWAYPVLLVALSVGLSAAGLSGTSVGVLRSGTAPAAHDPSLVAGTPRPVRSDEWNVATPMLVGQSHRGYANTDPDGLGPHELVGTVDVPSTDWSTAFKPWNLPPLVLDVEHGFAARWWTMSLLLLLGAYLLLLALTDSTLVAVVFSLGLWLSPFFHWWYMAITLDSVGLGMLALAALLYGLRAGSRLRRAAWLAVSSYALVGFALVLYPPFQVPVALVLLLVGVAEVAGSDRAELPWRRVLVGTAGCLAAAGGVLLAVYLHEHAAFSAINDTVFPGRRRVGGGDPSLLQTFSAPFGFVLSRQGAAIPPTVTNQSEVSSFLLLGPFALFQVQRVGLGAFTRRWRYLVAGTSCALILIALWYFVSLPPAVAAVLQLDRVETYRAILGVGVAGFLLMALLCAAPLGAPAGGSGSDGARRPPAALRRRLLSGAVMCGVLAFCMYLWGGRNLALTIPALNMSLWKIGAFSALAAVVVLLLSARQVLLGGLGLVVVGALASLGANPLYQGLGPLTSSPLLRAVQAQSQRPPSPARRVWLPLTDGYGSDILTASGQPTLGGVSFYPDVTTWKVLDPRHRQAQTWNRYANLVLTPAAPGAPTTLTLVQQDLVEVRIDPCGAAAGRLHVGFVLSSGPLPYPCLEPRGHLSLGNLPEFIYVRRAT